MILLVVMTGLEVNDGAQRQTQQLVGGSLDPPPRVSVAGQGPALLGMSTGEDKHWLRACLWCFSSLLTGWLADC